MATKLGLFLHLFRVREGLTNQGKLSSCIEVGLHGLSVGEVLILRQGRHLHFNNEGLLDALNDFPVSYTHLTLPTKLEV